MDRPKLGQLTVSNSITILYYIIYGICLLFD